MIIPIRYGIAQTIYGIPLVTAGGTAFQTTWTPAAGECQYSIDGGVYANLNSNPTHEGNGIWSQALIAAECSGDYISLSYSDGTTDIEDQAVICSTLFSGQIEANEAIVIAEVDTATFTATNTVFEALYLSPTTGEPSQADTLNTRQVLFTSGAHLGERADISDYELANSKAKITLNSALAGSAPADGDRFVIL